MPLKITEDIRVRVDHVAEDGTTFNDAIYLTKEQRAVLTDADLVVMGNARVKSMQDRLEAARAKPVELTEEQKQEQIDNLINEKVRLDTALAQVDPVVLEARKEVLGIADELPPDEIKVGGLTRG